MKPWILASLVAAPIAVIGGGYLWLRKKAPALAPSLGGSRFRPGSNIPKLENEEQEFDLAFKVAEKEGPSFAKRVGRIVDGEVKDFGTAQRQSDGTYRLEWQSSIWISDKPSRNPQYRSYGGPRWAFVNAIALDWWSADMWLKSMGSVVTESVWSLGILQDAIVNPWPPAKSGPYNCKVGAPGIDAVKNIACGLWNSSRDKIELRVHPVGDWYVARWVYGPLAAGPDLEEVKQIGYQAAKRINQGQMRA